MGKKAKSQAKPAPVVAKHPALIQLEGHQRRMIYVIKRFQEGDEAGLQAIDELRLDGFDPGNVSASANVSVALLDSKLSHADKFTRRKPGSLSKETIYIRDLCLVCRPVDSHAKSLQLGKY